MLFKTEDVELEIVECNSLHNNHHTMVTDLIITIELHKTITILPHITTTTIEHHKITITTGHCKITTPEHLNTITTIVHPKITTTTNRYPGTITYLPKIITAAKIANMVVVNIQNTTNFCFIFCRKTLQTFGANFVCINFLAQMSFIIPKYVMSPI